MGRDYPLKCARTGRLPTGNPGQAQARSDGDDTYLLGGWRLCRARRNWVGDTAGSVTNWYLTQSLKSTRILPFGPHLQPLWGTRVGGTAQMHGKNAKTKQPSH